MSFSWISLLTISLCLSGLMGPIGFIDAAPAMGENDLPEPTMSSSPSFRSSTSSMSIERNCENGTCIEKTCENGDCKERQYKREFPKAEPEADVLRSLLSPWSSRFFPIMSKRDETGGSGGVARVPHAPIILFGSGILRPDHKPSLSPPSAAVADPSQVEIAPIVDNEKPEEEKPKKQPLNASKIGSSLEKLFSTILSAVREYQVQCKNGVCTTSTCENGKCEENYSIEKAAKPTEAATGAAASESLAESPKAPAQRPMSFSDFFGPSDLIRPWYRVVGDSKSKLDTNVAIKVKTTRITCFNGDCKTEICDQDGCKVQDTGDGQKDGAQSSPVNTVLAALEHQKELDNQGLIPNEPLTDNEITSNDIPVFVTAEGHKKIKDLAIEPPRNSAAIALIRPAHGGGGFERRSDRRIPMMSRDLDQMLDRMFRPRFVL